MQKVSEPAFVKLLQEAVNQGQVVLVPAPDRPLSQRPAPTTPPLRDRDEASLIAAFCLLFKLRRTESLLLVKLATCDYSTKEELRAAASQDGQAITAGSMNVFISSLRKKLTPHGIKLTTVSGLGYGLDQKARDKIRRLLAKYDTGIIPTTPRSKPKAIEPGLEPDASAA